MKKDTYKYLVTFPVTGEDAEHIRALRGKIGAAMGLPLELPDSADLFPHLTLVRPVSGIHEELVVDHVHGLSLLTYQTRLRYVGLDRFSLEDGSEMLVLPVVATQALAGCWSGLMNVFRSLDGFTHFAQDRDCTPHISLHSSRLVEPADFELAWKKFRFRVRPREIVVDRLSLYRKPAEGAGLPWEIFHVFPLKPYPAP